jgi:formylglycine-generating enzyme required for sulfatase activity
LTNNYFVSRTEVTQGQYGALMFSNPSSFDDCGSDCPVENVSWNMAAAYANALSASEGRSECYDCSGSGTCDTTMDLYDCNGYRLLTEAEWEIAARCGSDELYAGDSVAGAVAWYAGNSGGSTRPVGGKRVNDCGLYDMSGNVYEWVHDWYADYAGVPVYDPVGPETAEVKIGRGGDWNSPTDRLRVADRDRNNPGNTYSELGFRIGRTAD